MIRAYEPSGKVSFLALATFPLAVAVAAGLGYVSALARVHADVALVNGLACLVGLIALGASTYFAIRLGRVRHRLVGLIAGAAAGAAFIIAIHLGGYLEQQTSGFGLAARNLSLGAYIEKRARTGWKVPGFTRGTVMGTVQGFWIYALWVVELMLALLVGAVAGIGGASVPFCESCRRHARREAWRYTLSNPSPGAITQIKQATNLSALIDIDPSSRGSKDKLDYVIRSCRCGKTASLGIRRTWFDNRGEKQNDWLFNDALLDAESLERLYRWAEARNPAMAAKRAALDVGTLEHVALNKPAGAPEHGPRRRIRGEGAGISAWGRDNKYLSTLRSKLSLDNDYEAAEQAIAAQRDVNDLAAVVDACSDWSSPPKWLDDWAIERPDSPSMLLVRGAHRLTWAWQARGVDWTPQNIDLFLGRLRMADADLARAAELRPSDPVPWSLMIPVAKGLQLGKEETARRFKESIRRSPALVQAYSSMLSTLMAKWGGSHDEMFSFARQVSAKAPAGSAVHCLVAEAHVEYAAALEREQGKHASRQHWGDSKVLGELQAAAEKCFRGIGDPNEPNASAGVKPPSINHAYAAVMLGAALESCGDKATAKRIARTGYEAD